MINCLIHTAKFRAIFDSNVRDNTRKRVIFEHFVCMRAPTFKLLLKLMKWLFSNWKQNICHFTCLGWPVSIACDLRNTSDKWKGNVFYVSNIYILACIKMLKPLNFKKTETHRNRRKSDESKHGAVLCSVPPSTASARTFYEGLKLSNEWLSLHTAKKLIFFCRKSKLYQAYTTFELLWRSRTARNHSDWSINTQFTFSMPCCRWRNGDRNGAPSLEFYIYTNK